MVCSVIIDHKMRKLIGSAWITTDVQRYVMTVHLSSAGEIVVFAMHWDTLKQDNYSTVRGDGGSRVGEVRAGTTSPMPEHKGFMLQ